MVARHSVRFALYSLPLLWALTPSCCNTARRWKKFASTVTAPEGAWRNVEWALSVMWVPAPTTHTTARRSRYGPSGESTDTAYHSLQRKNCKHAIHRDNTYMCKHTLTPAWPTHTVQREWNLLHTITTHIDNSRYRILLHSLPTCFRVHPVTPLL